MAGQPSPEELQRRNESRSKARAENPASELPEIIGMPPMDTYVDNWDNNNPKNSDEELALRTFPILEIKPMKQKIAVGTELYQLDDGLGEFNMFLQTNGGYTLNSKSKDRLKVCYLHTSPFSETFTNDFGPSAIANITSPMSESYQEVAMLGGEQIGKVLGTIGETADNWIRKLAGDATADKLEGALQTARETKVGKILESVGRGGKLNFPTVWKASSYSPSYDITVRLFNFFAGNEDSYRRLVLGPLMAFMAFVLPRSEDGNTYKWPLHCRVTVPGHFDMVGGYIKSLSIVKGGDVNDVGWNMRPSTIDLRISFGDIYNTMVGPFGAGAVVGNATPSADKMHNQMKTIRFDPEAPRPAFTNISEPAYLDSIPPRRYESGWIFPEVVSFPAPFLDIGALLNNIMNYINQFMPNMPANTSQLLSSMSPAALSNLVQNGLSPVNIANAISNLSNNNQNNVNSDIVRLSQKLYDLVKNDPEQSDLTYDFILDKVMKLSPSEVTRYLNEDMDEQDALDLLDTL